MTVIIICHLQSRLLENTATVEREEREVTRAGSQATLLAVYTICEVWAHYYREETIYDEAAHLTSVEVQDTERHGDHLAPVHDGEGGLPLVGGGRGLASLLKPTVPDVNWNKQDS